MRNLNGLHTRTILIRYLVTCQRFHNLLVEREHMLAAIVFAKSALLSVHAIGDVKRPHVCMDQRASFQLPRENLLRSHE